MINDRPKRIAVIGGGSWGTAITKILSENKKAAGSNIEALQWWIRNEETAAYIRANRHNPKYISSVEIHPEIVSVSSNLQEIINTSDLIVMAVPSAFLKEALDSINAKTIKNKFIVSAIKGLLPHSRQIVADFLMTEYGLPHEQLIVISGPCHAEEVASEKLSYLTIAGLNESVTAHFASLLACRYIRTIISKDITGTEYGAVLKNIYAVASGICHGLGFGDNFQAVLISNAIREMERFLYAMHAHPREINHSAYLGDLLVTAYSQHSRNRTFGNMLGKGYSVKSAQLEMNMIAEGYYATKSMHELNNSKLKVDMPIMEAVYGIIYENKSAQQEINRLCEKLI
ncbi:MAG: NAD(P)H-dependent glycerol-3-phosphate dehydrogenase [Bacteroidota bacterium]|jgi:glycerol-3-phosphate dehydrogenase (NAD(P)+)|nr:NAD(P)H-dependent glycerol-3-phosphate dehydrogenase [Sphingobacteriales bacterium]